MTPKRNLMIQDLIALPMELDETIEKIKTIDVVHNNEELKEMLGNLQLEILAGKQKEKNKEKEKTSNLNQAVAPAVAEMRPPNFPVGASSIWGQGQQQTSLQPQPKKDSASHFILTIL